jgi:type VI secretion system protein VasJ
MSQNFTAAEILEMGTRPIRPDAPAGDPGRDEPQFEVLQAEIGKLEHPDGRQPDWNAVINAAAELLGQKSKDLLPASYLCVALFQRDGYAGLVTGLSILKELIDRYWETLYPELRRMRGRTAAVEWLVERGSKAIENRPPEPDDGEWLTLCRTLAAEVASSLEPKLESGWQILQSLQRVLEESEQRIAGPGPSAPTPSVPDSGVEGRGSAQIRTMDDAVRAIGDVKELARGASEVLRTNDPADPLSYRLLRLSCWLNLAGPPPNENGQTQIPPPQPQDLATRIQALLDEGQWTAALEQSESRLPTAVLWVDLHRFTVTALEGMGESFLTAAQTVVQELAQLLARVPGLESLRFQNGQPLADERTRAWIRERVGAPDGSGGQAAMTSSEGPPASAGSGDEFVEERARLGRARDEARNLARRKKLPEALRLLEDGAGKAHSLKGRAMWNLEMARLCLEAGAVQTALAQLVALDEDLQSSRCEDWAPDLCLEVLKALYTCHQKVMSAGHPASAADVARARDLLGRVSRLDPGSAVSLEGKG